MFNLCNFVKKNMCLSRYIASAFLIIPSTEKLNEPLNVVSLWTSTTKSTEKNSGRVSPHLYRVKSTTIQLSERSDCLCFYNQTVRKRNEEMRTFYIPNITHN